LSLVAMKTLIFLDNAHGDRVRRAGGVSISSGNNTKLLCIFIQCVSQIKNGLSDNFEQTVFLF